MPVACVGISLNTEIHQEMPSSMALFSIPPFITDTDSLHHLGGTDTLFYLLRPLYTLSSNSNHVVCFCYLTRTLEAVGRGFCIIQPVPWPSSVPSEAPRQTGSRHRASGNAPPPSGPFLSFSQYPPQIHSVLIAQTGFQIPLGRKAHPVAVAAEFSVDRADQSDTALKSRYPVVRQPVRSHGPCHPPPPSGYARIISSSSSWWLMVLKFFP